MDEKEQTTLVIEKPSPVLADTKALIAAISCVDVKSARENMSGIYVHRVDDTLRIVSTDGHRLFLNARERVEGEEWPEWLGQGVVLPTEGLKPRLALVGDLTKVSYAAEAPFVLIGDRADSCQFRLRANLVPFTQYQPVLDRLKSFEGHKVEEMTSTAFNSKYFKSAGDLAKALGSDEIRVHAMAADQGGPTLITFPSSPGSMLLLMPMRADDTMSRATIQVLAAPLQGTLNALRAHKTRWERKSGKVAEARVAEYERRIAEITSALTPALPAPSPAVEEQQPEAEASVVSLMTSLADPVAVLVSHRSKLTNGQRKSEMTRFVADINAALNGHDGLTLGQLADGVPVDDWFDAGLTPDEACKRALDWRKIGSVLPPNEVQPGEADKPIGLLQSAAAPKRESRAMAADAKPPTKAAKPRPNQMMKKRRKTA